MKIIEDTYQSPYVFKSEKRKDYFYTYVGDCKDSLEVSKEYWLRALNTCSKNKYKKMLIEENLDGELSSSEIYELSVGIAELDFKDIAVAFVDRHIEHKESNQFGESIVTTRGLRIKVFNTIKEAEEWLSAN